MSENQGLPEKMCNECVSQVSIVYHFKQKCETSNNILRSLLEKRNFNQSFPLSLEPKLEVVSDLIVGKNSSNLSEKDTFEFEELKPLEIKLDPEQKQLRNECGRKYQVTSEYDSDQIQITSDCENALPETNKPIFENDNVRKSFVSKNGSLIPGCGNNKSSYVRKTRLMSKNKPVAGKRKLKKASLVNSTLSAEDGADGELYECKICKKSYKQNAGLVWHMKMHTGERPFLCSQCGRFF